jgi:hypothetical protein
MWTCSQNLTCTLVDMMGNSGTLRKRVALFLSFMYCFDFVLEMFEGKCQSDFVGCFSTFFSLLFP